MIAHVCGGVRGLQPSYVASFLLHIRLLLDVVLEGCCAHNIRLMCFGKLGSHES